MRDKRYGWNHRLLTSINLFQSIEICNTFASNTFMDGFGQEIFYRPSCYECRFANCDRPGDITLADFWNIEKFSKLFDGIQGVSCCLCNTEKGEKVIKMIQSDYLIEKRSLNECLHPNRRKPTSKNPKSYIFWEDWKKTKGDFGFVARKYFKYNNSYRLKVFIAQKFPYLMKIKKMIR
jgi:hypothetical protein